MLCLFSIINSVFYSAIVYSVSKKAIKPIWEVRFHDFTWQLFLSLTFIYSRFISYY